MSSDADLTRLAAQHSLNLQLASAAGALCILQLTFPLADWLTDAFPSLSVDQLVGFHFVWAGALFSVLASWSAIWTVLGSGRWLTRLAISFAIYHLTIAVGLTGAVAVQQIRDSSELDPKDLLATFAGASYVFAGQMLASMFLVWLLKRLRYRLVYFDEPATYPHPRRAARDIPISARRRTTILSGRVFLADIFALTTMFAIYLGAWYPLVEVALQDDRFLGASFTFMIVLVCMGGIASIGLAAVLLPMIVSMLDRRGPFFQFVCHSAVWLTAWYVMVGMYVKNAIDPDAYGACVGAIIALAVYETAIVITMHRPTKWFRFRLARP